MRKRRQVDRERVVNRQGEGEGSQREGETTTEGQRGRQIMRRAGRAERGKGNRERGVGMQIR